MEKVCPKCGVKFECLHNVDCWCMQVKTSEQTLKLIQQNYTDCLCKACLESIEEDSKKNLAQ